jgi:hypothetical protein
MKHVSRTFHQTGRKYKERTCGGCGESFRMPSGYICSICAGQLELGREREKELDDMKESEEKITVAIDHLFSWSPPHGTTVSAKYDGNWPGDSIDYRDVVEALVHLSRAEKSKKVTDRHIYSKPTRGYSFHPIARVWLTTQQADGIELILTYIRFFSEWYYDRGYEAGSNILMRMAHAGEKESRRLATLSKKETE